ncbi:MAG: hypothetical protein C4547_07735 [Phycisphaerales bacterium]|nr:MAG: hypothetical protein C4547_07735 [Phycisphaerales bacterium]
MSQPAGFEGAEVWMKMWSDVMSQMASAAAKGAAPLAQPPPDPARRMRDAFFNSWAKYCEEFMRSEPFLEMMKQSIESSLAVRQQMNQLLRKGMQEAQVASRGDSEDILRMLHSVEDRLLERLDDLSQRVEAIERSQRTGGAADTKGG